MIKGSVKMKRKQGTQTAGEERKAKVVAFLIDQELLGLKTSRALLRRQIKGKHAITQAVVKEMIQNGELAEGGYTKSLGGRSSRDLYLVT